MLAYAAMMTGQRALAMKHIRAMVAEVPRDFLKESAMLAEGYLAMPLEVLVRFGRWDEILAESDQSAEYMPFTRAFHHAARAIAYAAKGDVAHARKAQGIYLERAKLVPKEDFIWSNNSCEAILGVVTPMVEGEILVAESKTDDGLAQLRAAVAAEGALKYDEPPGWLIPIRHSLGATLMRAGIYPGVPSRSIAKTWGGCRITAGRSRPGGKPERAEQEPDLGQRGTGHSPAFILKFAKGAALIDAMPTARSVTT